ncbi:porphobilinogen deaminase [Kiloniella litopenaei]|uniref:Porphobilinogen deaminase n=1 Tax=Kiloniella litopenaei TaxID=1549748 RepID=A0A0M2R732_9PROT|nr:hydroxymethylbilane synthase [Kiloniella litopenaei]KKJ75820.1 porphobilinogen deaminase [Kiloniella litopenaei]
MTDTPILRLGTRGSPLALAQAFEVKRLLQEAHSDLKDEESVEIVVIKTTGDKIQDRALSAIGGKGLFTKEIEDGLQDGSIDIAVHSMKDVPTWLPDGLEISTVLEREDPRDALFSSKANSLADLPKGAVVGSASLRRQAQIKAKRPDLEVITFRGSVQTRLRKLEEGQVDATLLAVAGLNRLKQSDLITAALSTEEMLPAPAQGAVGLEVRIGDDRVRAYVDAIHHEPTMQRITAERACLAELDGSCRTPIAALAEIEGDELYLRTMLAATDGSKIFTTERRGPISSAEEMGRSAGRELKEQAGEAFFKTLEDQQS